MPISRSSYPVTPPATPPVHSHTLTYLTSRQPSSVKAHSLLRRSYIRTLSCEQLPRTHSGPLFFGDDQSGYTISFVFRLSDPCARGRVRRYAFIAWAGREERRAARAYKDVVHVFAGMAGRIVDLVERRQAAAAAAAAASSTTTITTTTSTFHPDSETNVASAIDAGASNNHHNNHHNNGGGGSRESTPVSSFLSGRSIDPDGHARRSEVRAKGLAELVGKDDVFVEMHAAFVHLLAQLGRHGHYPHHGHHRHVR